VECPLRSSQIWGWQGDGYGQRRLPGLPCLTVVHLIQHGFLGERFQDARRLLLDPGGKAAFVHRLDALPLAAWNRISIWGVPFHIYSRA
jgi:hypothetical protein